MRPDDMAPRLSIRLFGAFEFCRQGELSLPLTFRKSQVVLAMLALRTPPFRAGEGRHPPSLRGVPGEVHPLRGYPVLGGVERGWMAGHLWPDSEPAAALHSLRNCLTDLRRALGIEAFRLGTPASRVLILDLAGAFVDVLAFDAALARGDEAALKEAIALYRGPLLPGRAETWVFQERQAREQAMLGALERLAGRALVRGDPVAAEQYLRQAAVTDPLRESTQRALMQALAATGNYARALACYRELRLRLHEQQQSEPERETQALFEQLRAEAQRRNALPAARPHRSAPSAPGSAARPAPFKVVVRTASRSHPASESLGPTPTAAGAPGDRSEKRRELERLQAPLVGRDEELAALSAVLTALAQRRGQIVTIVGEAGVGKSRLVREAREYHKSKIVWLEGRCLERSGATGYAMFVDLLRDYFGWGAESDRDRGSCLAAALQAMASRGELTADRVEEMGPVLGHLLAARFGTSWDRRLENAGPEQIQHQTFLAVRDFLTAVARRQPLLLVLEDFHWADHLTVSLVRLLLDELPRVPIGLFCVYRPEPGHPTSHLAAIAERKCGEQFTQIRLRDLTPEQTGQLAMALLSGSRAGAGELLSTSFRQQIVARSRGNPLFLEELLHSLIDRGCLSRDGDRWQVRGEILELGVPESIQSLILSRVDRLPPALQQILEHAAVIGRVFRPRLLAAVLGSDEGAAGPEAGSPRPDGPDLSTALWDLESLGLVYEERVVPEVEYSFKHVLVQETIYQHVPRHRRADLHQRVAEALEALYRERLDEQYEALAFHYDQGTQREKAVEYLLKAGEKARRAYMNESAIDFFRSALARLDGEAGAAPCGPEIPAAVLTPPVLLPNETAPSSRLRRYVEALRGLGETYQGIGRHVEAEQQFRRAIELGQEARLEPPEWARLLYLLGDTLSWQGRAGEMVEPAEAMLERWGAETESVEIALMNQLAAMGHRWRGDRERGLEYLRRNARFLHRLPYSELLRAPYYNIMTACSEEEDDLEAANHWAQMLESRARQHHDWRAVAGATEARSGFLRVRGDFRGAIPPLQEAMETYGRIGGLKHQFLCCIALRESFLSLGNLEAAEAAAREQLSAAETLADARSLAVALFGLRKVLLSQQRGDEAGEVLQRALHVCGEDRWMRDRVLYEAGRASLAQGNRPEARRQLLEASMGLEAAHFVDLCSALEETWEDPEAFRTFCRDFRAAHPEAGKSPLLQWHLEPAQPAPALSRVECCLGEWVWHDPFGDCSFTMRQEGLEIRAANGRDLWHPNQSAPRMLRSMRGDFTLQVVCRPVSARQPAMGGLLLWANKEQYFRLEWGSRGRHQITAGGCLPALPNAARGWWGSRSVIVGRGRLVGEQVFLRLERRRDHVRALCSADGQAWFTVGQVPFPSDGPLEVGVHALGSIDRMVYPGAHPEGAAIGFELFELWR